MSISISNGYTDTNVSGITAPILTTNVLNFSTDWRVKSESSKEALLVNTTSPLDQPERIRYGYSEIANIYAKSGLNSDQINGSLKGVNLLAQVTETLKVTDTSNSVFTQYLPVSAHLVLKLPQSAYITTDQIQALITRLISTLYQNGVSIIPALSKGVLVPKGL